MQLRSLYNQYVAIISGTNTQKVGSADFRTVEYGAGNLDALITHYNGLWDLCGPASGLPRLSATGSNVARRGRPQTLG
jgi:hypothetical protein